MRRAAAIFVAICLWCGPALAQWFENFRAGIDYLEAGKHAQARDAFSKALESEWITAEQRGDTYYLRGLSRMALGERRAARADFDEAVKLQSEPGPALLLRADLAWQTGDREQALKDTLRIAREFPSEVNDIDVLRIWALWRWLNEEGRADDRFLLLETVLEAGYDPAEPGWRADSLVKEYVRMLIEQGKRDEALPWAMKIVDAVTLLEMRVSGAFRPLWNHPDFAARSRPRAAAERDLRYWEAAAQEHPKSLKVVHWRMQTLRMLGEFDTAIQLGERVSKLPAPMRTTANIRPGC